MCVCVDEKELDIRVGEQRQTALTDQDDRTSASHHLPSDCLFSLGRRDPRDERERIQR